MICWGMFGNGVQMYMMRKYMVRTAYSGVAAGLMKQGVVWRRIEDGAILQRSKLMTSDFALPETGKKTTANISLKPQPGRLTAMP